MADQILRFGENKRVPPILPVDALTTGAPRYAAWRPSVELPVFDVCEQRPWTIFWFGPVIVTIVSVALMSLPGFSRPELRVSPLIAFSVAGLAIWLAARIIIPRGSPLKKFRDAFPADDLGSAFAVKIRLERHGVPYGEDYGYLRFEEDTIFFEGIRTSFSFSNRVARQAPSVAAWASCNGNSLSCALSHCIWFPAGDAEHALEIQRIHGRKGKDSERALQKSFVDWHQANPRPWTLSVLPPVASSPDELVQAKFELTRAATRAADFLVIFILNFLTASVFAKFGKPYVPILSDRLLESLLAILPFFLVRGTPSLVFLLRRAIPRYQATRRRSSL
jgi:hypothetical protein